MNKDVSRGLGEPMTATETLRRGYLLIPNVVLWGKHGVGKCTLLDAIATVTQCARDTRGKPFCFRARIARYTPPAFFDYTAHGTVLSAIMAVSCSCMFNVKQQEWNALRFCELCLLCFDINQPDSLLAIANDTFPSSKREEKERRRPRAYILVGLQQDLRSKSSIPLKTCRRYADYFGADSYVEVSALKKTNIKILVSRIQESLYNIHERLYRHPCRTIPELVFEGPEYTSLLEPQVCDQIIDSQPTQPTGLLGFLSSLLPSTLQQAMNTAKPFASVDAPRCIPIFGNGSTNPEFLCYGHVCHHFNGTLFFFGGMNANAHHCVQRFDMKAKQWFPPITCERRHKESGGEEKNAGRPEIRPVLALEEHSSVILHQDVANGCDPQLESLVSSELPTPLTASPLSTSDSIQNSELPPLVSSCFPASSRCQNTVYLFGGCANDDTNDFFQFDMATFLWSSLNTNCTTALPTPKHGASLVNFCGNLFLFGGNSYTVGACNTLHVYNISSKEWNEIPTENTPTPRYHHSSFVTRNGMLIVYGGIAANNTKLDDIWALNLHGLGSSPPKRRWEAITPTGAQHPTPQRGNVGCFLSEREEEKFVLVSSTNSNPVCEFFLLDLKNFSWTQVATQDTPAAREFHSVTPISEGSATIVVASGMWRRLQSDVLGDAFCVTLLPAYSSPRVLPDFCWLFVFAFLRPADLCRLGRVSKEFYRLTGLNEAWLPHFPADSQPSDWEQHRGNLKLLWIKRNGRLAEWVNPTPGVVKYRLPQLPPPEPGCGCFLGDGKVLLADLSHKTVEDIQPGDCVLSGVKMKPRTVIQVRTRAVNKQYNLVFIQNVGLTTGHPIFMDGKWTRPVEVKQPTSLFVGTMYDFVLDGESAEWDHSVIINGLTVCTLGNDCGVEIRSRFPTMDDKYGAGFWAVSTLSEH
ncbi:hypothetical protein Pelo_7072 [Pelomyxa schiedti]|nr:hypothetical protein Pelo_7072 [Pelomyxa schiedti]